MMNWYDKHTRYNISAQNSRYFKISFIKNIGFFIQIYLSCLGGPSYKTNYISVALLFISRKSIVAWLEINNNEGETEKLSFMQIFVNKVPCDIVLKIHQRKKNNELL